MRSKPLNSLTEHALRIKEQQLKVILDGIADGVIVFDTRGTLIYVNEQATTALGYQTEEEVLTKQTVKNLIEDFAIGSRVYDCSNHSLELSLSQIMALVALRENDLVVKVVNSKKNKEKWLKVRTRRVYDQVNGLELIVSIISDLTEIKELERRKDDFISMASHELKTPLTSVKLLLGLLIKIAETSGDELRLYRMKLMGEQIDRLVNLINDMLDVTRMEEGKIIFKKDKVDYTTLLTKIIAETNLEAKRHKICLECEFQGEVYCDSERIIQVIKNLLSNAMKYSPNGNQVIVRVREFGDNVETSVQDFGIGIAKELQSRLFSRFYRAGIEDENKYPGLGIGLYISNKIIVGHQGKMWVKSEQGNGATFGFIIPKKGGEI